MKYLLTLAAIAALALLLYTQVIKPVKQTIEQRTQAIERALNGQH